jgi:hypothetical protein
MLFDETIRDSVPISVSGMNDLRRWQMPIETRPLQISTSRWGHQFTLRQSNGEEFPLCVNQSQGYVIPSGAGAWYSSYYCFNAVASVRIGADAVVHDVTTDEDSPLLSTLSTGNSLIGWIALMPPQQVTAVQAGMNEVGLTWSIDDASGVAWLNEGKFTLERQTDAAGPWSYVTTVAAATTPDGPWSHSNTMLLTGHQYQYRVRYLYGEPNAPERHSDWSPSNSVTLPFDASSDVDGDGILDSVEITYGFDPSDPSDAAGDADSDDVSNGEEIARGLNPNDADSDDDQVNDGDDKYPKDPRRSDDIPEQKYAKIDITEALKSTVGANAIAGDIALSEKQIGGAGVGASVAVLHSIPDANGQITSVTSTVVNLSDMSVLRHGTLPLTGTSTDGTSYRLAVAGIMNDGRNGGDGRLIVEAIVDVLSGDENNTTPVTADIYTWQPSGPPPSFDFSSLDTRSSYSVHGVSNDLMFGSKDEWPQPPGWNHWFVNDYRFPQTAGGDNFGVDVAGGGSALGDYDVGQNGSLGLFRDNDLSVLLPLPASAAADSIVPLAINDGNTPALVYHRSFVDPALTLFPVENYPLDAGETTDSLVVVQTTESFVGAKERALRGLLPEKFRKQVVPLTEFYTTHISQSRAAANVPWEGTIIFHAGSLEGSDEGGSTSGEWGGDLFKLETGSEPTLHKLPPDVAAAMLAKNGKGIGKSGLLATVGDAQDGVPQPPAGATAHAFLQIPVQIQASRAGVAGEKWMPDAGNIDNLLSVWDTHPQGRDWVKLRVVLPESYLQTLPANFIQWEIQGFSAGVPSNATETPQLRWPGQTGVRKIAIHLPYARTKYLVYVDLPDVGGLSEETLIDLLDNDVGGQLQLALIYAYSQNATLRSGSRTELRRSQRNALRHAGWVGMCASDPTIGPDLARVFSTSHEWTNKSKGSHAFESTMDLHNNYEGSLMDNFILQSSLWSALDGKLNAGDLWIWDSPGKEFSGLRTTVRSDLLKIFPSVETY